MTDTSQYCVMKVRECESCDGSGFVPFMGRGHAGTGCVYCAGTGKAWEPVLLEDILRRLGYVPLDSDIAALFGPSIKDEEE